MDNNIIPFPNDNNIIQEEPSKEVSLNDNQIKNEIETLSKDNQLFSK